MASVDGSVAQAYEDVRSDSSETNWYVSRHQRAKRHHQLLLQHKKHKSEIIHYHCTTGNGWIAA
jgi:hypothetical protein